MGLLSVCGADLHLPHQITANNSMAMSKNTTHRHKRLPMQKNTLYEEKKKTLLVIRMQPHTEDFI